MSTLSTGFVEGRLYRTCMFVYQLLVIEACLVVALLPTAAAVVLLESDPRNALLFAVAVIPAGPALVAGLYAVRRMEQSPVRDFVRGIGEVTDIVESLLVHPSLAEALAEIQAVAAPDAQVHARSSDIAD